MSTLYLHLISNGQIRRALSVTAERVMETDLTITPTSASLPTLVSTENIIGQINSAGFELFNSNVVNKISTLVNTYYLSTEQRLWHDMSIDLEVIPISHENVELYQEVGYMRSAVIQSVRDAQVYTDQGNHVEAKKEQDNLVDKLSIRARSKPEWWTKIPEFLVKTAIPFVFSAFMGFSLHLIFASVFGVAFHVRPEFL